MQGRTNVKDGIALNATISEKEVYGNNIVAGDFVTYKTVTSIEDFITSAGTTFFDDIVVLSNNRYVIGIDTYIYLVELNNGGFTLLNSYGFTKTASVDIKLCKYDNETFFLGVQGSSMVEIDVFKVINNQLTLHSQIRNNDLRITSKLHFDPTSRKLFFAGGGYMFFVPVNNDLSLGTESRKSAPVAYWFCSFLKDNILIASVNSTNSNATYLNKYIIDFNAETLTADGNLIIGGSAWTWDKMHGEIVGNHIVFCGRIASQQSYALVSVNMLTFTAQEFTTLIGAYSVGKNKGKVFETNKFLVNTNYLMEINEDTGVIVIKANRTPTSYPSLSSVGHDNIIYCMSTSQIGYLTYNATFEDLSEKEDKDYVRKYDGSKAIGVAKQSGTAGDTIEVYIPTV